MLKKLPLLLAFLCLHTANAQTPPPADLENLNKNTTTPVDNVADSVNEAIPQTIMSDMVKSAAPVMFALEENQKQPKANEEMATRIMSLLPYPTTFDINEETNELNIYGNKDGLKFKITRNIGLVLLTQSIIEDLYRPDKGAFSLEVNGQKVGTKMDLIDLDSKKISKEKFNVKPLNNHTLIVYESSTEQNIFMIGNIGNSLNIQVQGKGMNYRTKAINFFRNLDSNALKQAVNDDGRTISQIKLEIDRKTNNHDEIKRIFEVKE